MKKSGSADKNTALTQLTLRPPSLDFVGLYTFITVDYILNKAEGISFIHKIFL